MTPVQLEEAIGYAAYAYYLRVSSYYEFLTVPELALAVCHTQNYTKRALVSLARSGHVGAHDALCGMANFLTKIGDSLPLWLQEYIVSAAQFGKKPRRRGRDPWSNFLRDAAIGQAVVMVTQRFGIKATRNDATTAECGCSIVAVALDRYSDVDIKEAAVVAIWMRTAGRQLPLQHAPEEIRWLAATKMSVRVVNGQDGAFSLYPQLDPSSP